MNNNTIPTKEINFCNEKRELKMQEKITDPFTDSIRYGVETFLNDKSAKWPKDRYPLKTLVDLKPCDTMEDQIFEPTCFKISKWIKFRLHFCKSHFNTDTEGNITAVSEMKVLKDEVYITHTWLFRNGKLVKEEKL